MVDSAVMVDPLFKFGFASMVDYVSMVDSASVVHCATIINSAAMVVSPWLIFRHG